jgi:hypothetical protein
VIGSPNPTLRTGLLCGASRSVFLPGGLGFDTVNFPIVPTISDPGGMTLATGDAGITPEAMFDLFSTARSAPTTTYYIGSGGNDGNSGLNTGAKKASVSSAITAANATGQPAKFVLDGMEFNRAIATGGTIPTVDCYFTTASGRATLGTFDGFGTFTLDATFTNCYSLALTNIDRLCNRLVQNAYGNNADFTKMVDATTLNATTPTTADLWATDATKVYIRRIDGAVPTTTNTRLYRSTVSLFKFTSAINVFVENIDAEGGSTNAAFDYILPSVSALRRVFVAKNCTAKYAGGSVNTTARGFGIESMKGLAYLYGCEGSANATDGINFHDTQGSGLQFLTVNCSAKDNGRGTATSCNGHTGHDGCIGIDLAGNYPNNRGGSVRHVNASKVLLAGTYSSDLGDIALGGVTPPTAYEVDNTATMWCDRTKDGMTGGQQAYATSGAGTTIHKRNVHASAGASGGTGTIDTY